MVKLTKITGIEYTLVSTIIDWIRNRKRAENNFKKQIWVASIDHVKIVTKFLNLGIMKKTRIS